jgi:hypothetical protein
MLAARYFTTSVASAIFALNSSGDKSSKVIALTFQLILDISAVQDKQEVACNKIFTTPQNKSTDKKNKKKHKQKSWL